MVFLRALKKRKPNFLCLSENRGLSFDFVHRSAFTKRFLHGVQRRFTLGAAHKDEMMFPLLLYFFSNERVRCAPRSPDHRRY